MIFGGTWPTIFFFCIESNQVESDKKFEVPYDHGAGTWAAYINGIHFHIVHYEVGAFRPSVYLQIIIIVTVLTIIFVPLYYKVKYLE